MNSNSFFSEVLSSGVQDMKSSLSMLLSSLESISPASDSDDEAQSNVQATLHYEAARINAELFQLQTLHKLANKDLVPQIDEHYLSDVFEEQLANCDLLLQSRGITMEILCDENLNGYFDAELIGGVIYKTLVNCSRYSRSKIQLSAREESGRLYISIADDGSGYPQFMLDEALAQELPEQFNSTHLDLYSSRKIADLHTRAGERGKLHISNGGPYDGGVFEISLP